MYYTLSIEKKTKIFRKEISLHLNISCFYRKKETYLLVDDFFKTSHQAGNNIHITFPLSSLVNGKATYVFFGFSI